MGNPWKDTQDTLKKAGVEFQSGLTEEELGQIEQSFDFRFPPDLADFLRQGLPVSERWPNWRSEREDALRGMLDWPLEGICFDIENNNFWLDEWDERPAELEARFEAARRAIRAAPTLIPVVGHRYLPETPHEAGNPVLSVYQTDIICYGVDLTDFFKNQFPSLGRPGYEPTQEPRQVPFWSNLVS